MKSKGISVSLIEKRVEKGDLGVKTGRGLYDYGGMDEKEILRKRDRRYLQNLADLENNNAFEPI